MTWDEAKAIAVGDPELRAAMVGAVQCNRLRCFATAAVYYAAFDARCAALGIEVPNAGYWPVLRWLVAEVNAQHS